MIPILTASEMKGTDERAINEAGIPSLVLMENAARGCFEVLYELFERDVRGRTILVLCGGGNNGGDGLAIARHAAIHGMISVCVLLTPEDNLSPDAASQLQMLASYPEVEILNGLDALEEIGADSFDLVLDAMLGTGAIGAPRPPFADAVHLANLIHCPKIAVDIPTGLNSDTGEVETLAFEADVTITVGGLKQGLLLRDGPDYTGELFVVHIGTPPAFYDEATCFLLDEDTAIEGLPDVFRTRHKYDRGKAVVLAGSQGMSGAGILTASAAIVSGAGLVVIGVPESTYSMVVPRLPAEIMSLSLPDENGAFASDAFKQLKNSLERYSVIALGPGITQHPGASAFAKEVLQTSPLPLVLDADGLNAFVQNPDELREHIAPLIITPHHGEMARLLGRESAQVSEDPLETARMAAAQFDCIVVLKGAPTIVATPNGKAWINSRGNPGMATAGSGDVLTGVITGFIAGRELDDLLAGVLAAVYLHSLAGDIAADEGSLHSLTASDIIRYVPNAFRELEQE